MSERKPVLLYFYPGLSSFVVKDLRLMEQQFEVRHKGFLPTKKWQTPLVWLSQLFFLLRHIWQAKVLVCMFAGYHSYFPALFGKIVRKRTFIVAGGTDCVSFPSIGYGCFSKHILGKFTRWSFEMASHIVPVHEKLVWQDYSYQPNDFPHQGFRYHCPGLITPHFVIYNGYDGNFWRPNPSVKRQPNSFLTVCAGLDMRFTQKLKGIDLILEVAPNFPDSIFTIVGAPSGFVLPNQPPNIQLLPKMPLEDLHQVYCAHQFYLQLSMSEGFPNALCESMLCGCVPIVSQVGGMPDIISDSGFVLERRDAKLLINVLKKALQNQRVEQGLDARTIIEANYPESKREREFMKLISGGI